MCQEVTLFVKQCFIYDVLCFKNVIVEDTITINGNVHYKFDIYNGNLSMEQFFQSARSLSSWHVQEPKVQVKCINSISSIMYAQCQ